MNLYIMASSCTGLTKFVLAKTQNHVQIHQRDKQQQQEVHRKAGREEGRINILGSNIQIEVHIKVRIFNDFSSPWPDEFRIGKYINSRAKPPNG
jgi:hypothetical protein